MRPIQQSGEAGQNPALTRNRGPARTRGRVGAPGWIAPPSWRRRGLRRGTSGYSGQSPSGWVGFRAPRHTPGGRPMPLTRPASTRSRVAAAVAVLVAVGALIPSLAAAGTGPDLV